MHINLARPSPVREVDDQALIASAERTLSIESDGLSSLRTAIAGELARPLVEAVRCIGNARGRIIVTGMGKSGHVGQKVAATFASTGTPAFFVHPSEASHGDLGMITPDDVLIAMSWSGETVELTGLINHSGRFAVPLIAITSNPESALGRAAEVVLTLPAAKEACPHGLAPTTSTTMQLALGDALAITLLESRGFTAKDFKLLHPGGQLGATLKHVGDVMHSGEKLPLAPDTMVMRDAILTMTEKSFGCLGVLNDDGRLAGIITDGDLRRNMTNDLLDQRAGDVMTKNPKVVAPDLLASAALEMINTSNISALFVVEDERPVGIIHVHDLLRIGVA